MQAHFFERIMSWEDLEQRWRADYLWQGFRLPKDPRVYFTYEKTPEYLTMSEQHITRLHSMLPSVKIIAILRNPTSRAYSNFWHACRAARVSRIGTGPHIPPGAAGKTVVAEPENVVKWLQRAQRPLNLTPPVTAADVHRVTSCEPAMFEESLNVTLYLESCCKVKCRQFEYKSMYGAALQRWLRIFPPTQVKVILTEDFLADALGQMHDLETFLGLLPFNYSKLVMKNSNGFYVLKSVGSKANHQPYGAMPNATLKYYNKRFMSDVQLLMTLPGLPGVAERVAKHWLPAMRATQTKEEEEKEGRKK
mgnify:CR=1 FL=1